MRRSRVVCFLCAALLLTLACRLASVTSSEKVKPGRWDTTGDRRSFSGQYSCEARDKVILIVDENEVATLSTTGPVYVDYINCTLDPSGFEATYTIVGLADTDSKLITFTSCNDGGFNAEGSLTYRDDKPIGSVTCWHAKGEEAGEPAMIVWVPSDLKSK